MQLSSSPISTGTATPLAITGAYILQYPALEDQRGINTYPFVESQILQVIGREFKVRQVNVTYSLPHTFRGIHLTRIPPGQAKYVVVLAGECIDIMVDLREGSPTFLQQVRLQLSDNIPQAVFIPEGVGHGILCQETGATIMYACNQEYSPEYDITVNPQDRVLGLALPSTIILSQKDQSAPFLQEIILPHYKDYCVAIS